MKPFVKVLWHDACDSEKTWIPDAEVAEFGKEPLEVISWGWLVSKTKQYVTIAADYIADTDTYGRVTKIPTGMCQTIEEFKQE